MKKRPFIWDLLRTIVGALLIVLILNHWVIKPVRVVGVSMYPTLKDGQVGFSNIIINHIEEIVRFDIVILKVEQNNEPLYIVKRAIGLPNETIQVENDILYIDGEPIDQPFFNTNWYKAMIETSNSNFTNNFGPITLDDNEYFVLGDNRKYSQDSRFYGPFIKEDIVSKDIVILYPFNELKIIRK